MAPRPERERHEPLPGLTSLPRWLRRHVSPAGRRALLAACAALLVIVAVAVPVLDRAGDRRAARSARQDRARAAARLVELRRVQRPRALVVPGERGDRRALVAALEAAVLRDARARNRSGELDDRVTGVDCSPYEFGTPPRRPGVAILECVGLTGEGDTGYPFRARLDVGRGAMAWCRNVLPPAHPDEPHQVSLGLSTRCTGERPVRG